MIKRIDSPVRGGRALLLLPLLLLACRDGSDSGTGPKVPVPTRMEILTKDPVVQVGATLTLSARVLDQNGAAISGSTITWSSEDVTTAVIDAVTGLASGIDGGEVMIDARSGNLTASVSLLVSYPVDLGRAKLRIRTDTDSVVALDGFISFFADRLGTEVGDYMSVIAYSNGLAMAVVLPGRPRTEKAMLSSVDLVQLWNAEDFSGFSNGFLIVEKSIGAGREIVYVSRNGWLLPDRVEFPAGPGDRLGQIRARTVSTLDAYSVALDGDGNPVFTPIVGQSSIYGDLWSGFLHVPVAVVSASLTGGSYTGELAVEDATFKAFGDQFGILDFSLTDGAQNVAYLELYMHSDPSVGPWPISAADPLHLPTAGSWAALELRDDPAYWLSESGELRIDAAIPPPATDLSGELKGAFEISFGGWLPGPSTQGSTGQHMAANVSFHVPWLDYSAGATTSSDLPRVTPIISRLLQAGRGAAARPQSGSR